MKDITDGFSVAYREGALNTPCWDVYRHNILVGTITARELKEVGL